MDKSIDKQKDSCQICKKKFGGVFVSEHQCKRCLRTVCKECCTKKKNIFTKASMKMQQHRCCDACLPDSQMISTYIKQNGLAFNNQSKQGKQWSQLADIDLADEISRRKPLNNHQNPATLNQIWPSMTPSLRELIGTLVLKVSITVVDAVIKKVFDKINLKTNHTQFPFNLIVYLLCHCDQSNATKLFDYLSSISKHIDQKAVANNIQLLCAEGDIKIDAKTTKLLISFSKNFYKSLALCYFLNCMPIDVVHYIILETLLGGTTQLLTLTISCLVYQFNRQILAEKYDEKSFKNIMWKTVNLKQLQKSIKKLRKIILKQTVKAKKQLTQSTQIHQIKTQKSQSDVRSKDYRLSSQLHDIPTVNSLANELSQVPQEKIRKQSFTGSHVQNEQILLTKLNQASQFLRKLQSGELHDEEVNPQDLQSMQKYLDMIIQQNDKAIKQCEQFDELLGDIETQLYIKNRNKKSTQI